MTRPRRDRARARRGARRGARRLRSGISLIEIMVVIAIMAVVLGIGIPSLAGIFDLQQRSAARELAMTYSFLVNEAAMRNVTFRIAYNLDAGTYQIEVGDPNTLVFSDPETRAAYEAEREKEMKRGDKKKEGAEGEEESDALQRFAGLTSPGFQSKVTLPSNSMFAYVYTPQYDEPQTPSEEAPETEADQKIVYSYVFANGISEHSVVRIVSIDDPEDGYTIEVEPLSGKVSVDSEETEIGASMAWIPSEAPSYR
ncbi:MAG: prepilin-type N-terminal cleavage/methylation domain-containing protein [Pseudomonadota bacterium]|nr:prepilin-type N-terminal cleavage/methylation domain-containing protein [Pseudomonadota bacterium]